MQLISFYGYVELYEIILLNPDVLVFIIQYSTHVAGSGAPLFHWFYGLKSSKKLQADKAPKWNYP